MLRGLHEASKNWLGKAVMAVVMGLIVISFAIWGIGDIFRGFGMSTVAKVGGTEIGVEQFRTYYNDQLQLLGRQMRRPILPDQARALGLDRRFLGQMITETILDEQARRLKLGISDAEIAKRVTADPMFQGVGGKFDRNRFEQIIRQAGYTEPRFVAEQRRLSLRRELGESIGGGIKTPATLLAAVNRFQNEQRSIEVIALGAAQAGDIEKPTPEVLAKYFDERKALFRAPEYRKLTLLVLSVADRAPWTKVPDDQARKEYEEHKDKFGTPERRHLLQIVFPNTDEARAAADKIKSGTSFTALAAERGMKESDIDLGTVTKSGNIDPAVAQAAFSLKEGDVSDPVQSRFGPVLVQVTKIEPAQIRPYEDVAQEIKREIATAQAKIEVSDLRDKIEDERAGGANITEAAKKFGLSVRTINAVDRSGRAPDGSPVVDLPKGVDVVSAAFASDVGVDNDPLQIPNNDGFVWFEVAGITPSHERPLDEVKDQVENRWRDDEIAKRLKAKADDMVAKLKSGTTVATLAQDNGLKVETVTGLQRGHASDKVPSKVTDAAFTTPKDGVDTVEGNKATERFLFRVTEVSDPKLDANSPDTKRLDETLKQAITEDVLTQYISRLESDLGVTINQAVLQQVTGGSQN
ncbi:MAG TPA: peptidyl-prolyl cis-trans isomerase [Pseudolabrys sp.]|nr:peptidyl-prolyl cis-trans isomerase [Pseudolabrys sp.]